MLYQQNKSFMVLCDVFFVANIMHVSVSSEKNIKFGVIEGNVITELSVILVSKYLCHYVTLYSQY